jgi:hypothetical protein
MGATQPARGRPRPATPLPRTHQQPPRRPRRWGRLLAAGLALVLVAWLMPRALADPDGGGFWNGGDMPFVEPGDEASYMQPQVEQVETEQSQADQPPADAALTTSGGGGDAQANHQPPGDGQTQPGDTEQVTEEPDQADASQPKGLRDNAAGCADGSCSKQPQGNLAATVWSDENETDDGDGDEGYEDEEFLQSLTPERKVDFIEQRINTTESILQLLQGQPSEDAAEVADQIGVDLDTAIDRIDRLLQPQVDAGALPAERVAELRAKVVGLRGQIGDIIADNVTRAAPEAGRASDRAGAVDRAIAAVGHGIDQYAKTGNRGGLESALLDLAGLEAAVEPESDQYVVERGSDQHMEILALREKAREALENLGNPMSMVQPKEVGLDQTTTKGNQVVIPKPTGFGGNRPPEIPNQTVFTPPDAATRKLVTRNPGHTPTRIDTSIPPTPAIAPREASARTWAAVVTDWAPTALPVALAGLVAILCRGTCSLSTLGPALRRLDPAWRGVQVVPGHLQG